VNSWPFFPDFVWAEKDFWSLELLGAELDYLAVGQMIVGDVLFFSLFVLLVILSYWYSHVALHLFNFLYDFEFGGCMEYIATSPEEELEVLCHISASNINPLNSIVDRESLENGTAMANSIAAVEYEPGSFSSSVETQNRLLLEEYFWCSKLLEKDICGFSSVAEWVEWGLRQQNWMLFWLNFELVEDMAP